jgi:large subunit ribosomal protein L23
MTGIKPLATEKAIMSIESENVLTFEVNANMIKTDIKKELERLFSVKVEKIRTNIRGNKKYAYVKLNKKFPAIDVATKLGLM